MVVDSANDGSTTEKPIERKKKLMAKQVMDQFANKAIVHIIMDGANTLTFAPFTFGVGLFQGVGMVIHRIEYRPTNATLREIAAVTDALTLAVVNTNKLDDLVADDPSMMDSQTIVGMGAAVEPQKIPIISDFTSLPGGGLIVPANPMFVGMTSGGFAAAGAADVRMWFTFRQLADKDYLELLQSTFPANLS
jgi:hypothetical protein